VTISAEGRRGELGDFLRRRREALSPEEAGIAAVNRRRTPGLRREEVAERANMSIVYYERLERGRGPMPSAAMLAGIAKALRLTADQRAHLYGLAGQAAPPALEPPGYVDPGLAAALSAVAPPIPGAITDELGTVVEQNRMSTLLYGRMAGADPKTANLSWRWFTDPGWREMQEPASQHEATSRAYVADLRTVVARRSGQEPLVEELRAASEEFAARWDEHVVSALHCSPKRFEVAGVGRVDLECSVMLSPLSTQRLLLLRPAPGTPAAERLTRMSDTWLSTGRAL
jgi:transcriptional regulator with XRE-family HTH domain